MSEAPWTIRRLLEWTGGFFTQKQVDSPRLSAELILAHVLGVPRLKLYTDYERVCSAEQLDTFRALVKRAGQHEPIAYLTGSAHFFNLHLDVTPGVLIPRPDTETLVECVLQFLRNTPAFESPRILDLCTGSGCVALALAQRLAAATVFASDVSDTAVALARKNAEKLNLASRVTVVQGDLFAALDAEVDRSPFHIITANPPYIPSAAIESLDRNVRDYEPRLALDGGPDGLALHRRILDDAPARMLPGGRIYLEIQFDQRDAALALIAERPAFADAKVLRDAAGHDRVLTATRP